jgi:hypothetical protein
MGRARIDVQAVAHQIADRLKEEPDLGMQATMHDYGLSVGPAYTALDQAREIYSRWLLQHFPKPTGARPCQQSI